MDRRALVTGSQQRSSSTGRLGDCNRALARKKELVLALEESLRLEHKGVALVHQLQADRLWELLGGLRWWSCRLLDRRLRQ